ncbi:MAG: dihydroorotate dehydrogenase electron transfer subunit [Lachnospiraceae bacterium]|jgi:dihydroorotate dehydrogenase electron transfer subunit|nr:dihydroorotate dehydrogenase electron transfer subunit [Lachnospiraceae bacterium]
MVKMKTKGIVVSQEKLTDDVYSLWLSAAVAESAQAGQFIGIYPRNEATLLPRPLSICEVSDDRRQLRLVYRVVGQGTTEFTTYKVGDIVSFLGILGNGFPLDESELSQKQVFLVGGGIGIAPLVELAKTLPLKVQADAKDNTACSLDIFLGYRNQQTFLTNELKNYGNIHIATDDGSIGIHGSVIDAIEAQRAKAKLPDLIYACGPLPMLQAVKEYGERENIKIYLSLEERMACGIGACLGCVCKTKERDYHTGVYNTRICTEGPVYEAGRVIL